MKEVSCPICSEVSYLKGKGKLLMICPMCVSKVFQNEEDDDGKSNYEFWGDGLNTEFRDVESD